MITQHRQKNRVTQFGFGRIPVDIKKCRIAARRPVLENIPPPGVFPAADGHVVGHDIKHLLEPIFFERGA